MATSIPQSQKNIVRQCARRAWRKCFADVVTAKQLGETYVCREVGGDFVDDGTELNNELIDYWHANKITEPAAVFVAGEPGMREWDE